MYNLLKIHFKSKLYRSIKNTLNFEIPISSKWHISNQNLMCNFIKNLYKYKKKLNIKFLKEILAFLITLYEFDKFTKVMIALGLPYDKKQQSEHFESFTNTYILKWLPGMLTGRFIMARDFVRFLKPKNKIVAYNLNYMRTTVLKLYALPDLLILNSLEGVGNIVAKEAILVKLPTIAIASNTIFSYKLAFKLYGNNASFNYIKSFLYILKFASIVGRNLFFLNTINKMSVSENVLKVMEDKKKIFLSKNIINDNLQINFKQNLIYTFFNNNVAYTNYNKIKNCIKKFSIKNLYIKLKFDYTAQLIEDTYKNYLEKKKKIRIKELKKKKIFFF